MAEFPELATKMSKKIAQLTKVIYQLNTQNEDHQVEKETIQAQHGLEVDEIVANARAKIENLIRAIAERQEQVNLSAQLEQLKQKHETERAACVNDLAQLRREAKQQNETTAAEYENRVKTLRNEVGDAKVTVKDMKERFEATVAELRTARLSESEEAAAQLVSLREAHAAEVTQIGEAAAEQLKSSLASHLEACESLRALAVERERVARAECAAHHEHEFGRLRAELAADQQAALMTLERKWEQRLAEAGALAAEEGSKLRGEAEELRGQLTKAEQSAESLETKLAASSVSFEAAQKELERLRRDLAAARGDASSAERDLAKQLREAEAKGVELGQVVSTLEAQRTQHESMLAQGTEERRKLEATHVHFTKKMTEEMVGRDAQLADLSGEVQRLKSFLSEHQTSAAKAREEAAAVLKQSNLKVAALEAELAAMRAQGGVLEAGRLEAEDARRAQDAMWAKRVEELQAKSDKRAREQSAEHDAATRVGKEAHRSELSAAKKSAAAREQEQLAAEQVRAEAQAAALAAAAETAARDAEVAKHVIQQLEQQLAEERRRGAGNAAELKADTDKLRREGEALRKALAAAEGGAKRWEGKCEDAIKETEGVRREGGEAKVSAERRLKAKVEQVEAEWGRKLGELAAESDAGLEILKAEFARQRKVDEEKFAAELEASRQRLEAALASRESELGCELDEERKRFEEAAAAAEYLRLRDAQGLEAERARHAQEVAELRAGHTEALESLGSDLRASADAEKAALKAAHVAEVQAAAGAQSKATQSASDAHAKALADAQNDHNRALEASRNANSLELERLAAEAKSTLEAALCEQKSNLDAVAAASALALTAASDAERATLHGEVASLQGALSARGEECAALRVDLARAQGEAYAGRQESERRLVEATARAENEAHEVARQHAGEVDELRTGMQYEYDSLEAQFAALQVRWDTREGRPGDLQRIRELEEEVEAQERLVRKTLDDMAYFKRELLNREENFNQKFGANPNVGVMQVIKPSKQRQLGGKSKSERGSKVFGGGSVRGGASQQEQPAGPVLGGSGLGIGGGGLSIGGGRM